MDEGPLHVAIGERCSFASLLLLLFMPAFSVDPFSLCPLGTSPGFTLDFFYLILAEGGVSGIVTECTAGSDLTN